MEEELIALCQLHDEIKGSEIRLTGLEGHPTQPNYKDLYFKLLSKLLDKLDSYIEEYANEGHVKFGLRYGLTRNIIPSQLRKSLQNDYQEYQELLGFLAVTDFTVLSKAHTLIEYMYYLLTDDWYTEGFEKRLL